MVFHPSRGKAGLLALALTASFFVLIGCSNNEPAKDANSTPPNTGGTPPAGSNATPGAATASNDPGQAVFSSKCAGCHSINGMGGKKGPDLTHAGADAKHTPEWLTDFIKNPKSKDPGSRMPGFAGRITDDELKSLTTYLAGLK